MIDDAVLRPVSPHHSEPDAGLRVLVVGQGPRDHALVWKVAQSPLLGELHAVPGNPAMGRLATCHAEVELTDIEAIVALAVRLRVDFAIVAFEDLLVAGLASRLAEAGVCCLGPTAAAAQIEGSKEFAKELMHAAGVPTPASTVHGDLASASAAIRELGAPVVVKADGLAAGCGAFVCESLDEALDAAADLLSGELFGAAGSRIIVEEFIHGREASVMVLCDGTSVVPLPAVRDFKRLGDADTGPNTGGMGACSPPPDVSEAELARAVRETVVPVVDELRRRGTPFHGVLYAGVMFTEDGRPLALEYNCRFGNPETQVLVRLLEDDLLDLLHRAATERLAGVPAPRVQGAAVGVCIASANYPELVFEPAPVEVSGLDEAAAQPGVEVFVGPTIGDALEPGATAQALGGRVCTVTAVGMTLEHAAGIAYRATAAVHVPDARMRHDIGMTPVTTR